MDKLSLSDSNSEIFYKRRKEKGIVLSKEYILEVRIEAVKAAKEKAKYLLNAIG
ncbi:hypothetical protein [Winogradskyella sp. PG-2]|uniref:hypothetical protein n=1 Tax=Winogradskyella sp. PG-2 TaxID=754409 RepID=UPI0004589119|nr:hypothetical protein [Winogradskyella sp. PG-2]BAO74281.1 hypothetical protein WPG_0051 [Winogradskyella sp. PG-2]